MSNNLEKTRYVKELEDDIKCCKKIIENALAELDRIQKKCKHEAVVVFEKRGPFSRLNIEATYVFPQKCMICGKVGLYKNSFPNSKKIDVTNFMKDENYNIETKYSIVEEIFDRILRDNPDMSFGQVTEQTIEILKQIEAEYEESKK